MLRLDAVSKNYGGKCVLRRVTLTATPGSLTLVTGANGSGKTTLLHIMAGLARVDSGTVTYNGAPGSIAYLGHDTLIYPAMTALENLAFWCALHNKAHDEASFLDTLGHMNLSAFADTAASVFSRGMTQRLSLARVLLLAPSLVLLDEPLTGLDQTSTTLVRRALIALKSRGAALIWVTHDPTPDEAHANAVLTLHTGGGHNLRTQPAPLDETKAGENKDRAGHGMKGALC